MNRQRWSLVYMALGMSTAFCGTILIANRWVAFGWASVVIGISFSAYGTFRKV